MANLANRFRLAALADKLRQAGKLLPDWLLDAIYNRRKPYRRPKLAFEQAVAHGVADAKRINAGQPGYRRHTTNPKKVRRLLREAVYTLRNMSRDDQAAVVADLRRTGRGTGADHFAAILGLPKTGAALQG